MKHVVIAGGGFGGVRLARKLKNQKNVSVTLINNAVDFRYCPALYRAATGSKLGTARLPLEWMLLDTPRTSLVSDTVVSVDPIAKVIRTAGGQAITYDEAVFSLGSITTYFNIEGLHEHSYGIKTPEEVTQLRRHVHEKVTDKDLSDENYVIVGAGPTGVELAGGLGTYINNIARNHHVRKHKIQVWLVEAGPRILPQMTPRAARAVQKRLESLGVKILLSTAVTRETINSLKTSTGTIKTDTVIWTAGTANNPFFKEHPDVFNLNEKGRVVVNKHLQVSPHIYVIGDNAATPHSGLALTAIWHANFVSRDIKARSKNSKRPTTFEHAPIQVVPAGHGWAVLQYKRFVLHGRLIALVRLAADYIGYSDMLGTLKAMTIWSNSKKTEDDCDICNKNT